MASPSQSLVEGKDFLPVVLHTYNVPAVLLGSVERFVVLFAVLELANRDLSAIVQNLKRLLFPLYGWLLTCWWRWTRDATHA